MTWVKFSDKKPEEGVFLITRRSGNIIENKRIWKKSKLSIPPPFTHWWDGEPNFQLAIGRWKDEESQKI